MLCCAARAGQHEEGPAGVLCKAHVLEHGHAGSTSRYHFPLPGSLISATFLLYPAVPASVAAAQLSLRTLSPAWLLYTSTCFPSPLSFCQSLYKTVFHRRNHHHHHHYPPLLVDGTAYLYKTSSTVFASSAVPSTKYIKPKFSSHKPARSPSSDSIAALRNFVAGEELSIRGLISTVLQKHQS